MSITTSEMAVTAVESRYDLVLIAARRVRELRHGHAAQVPHEKNANEISIALQEIESGKIGRDYLHKDPNIESDKRRKAR